MDHRVENDQRPLPLEHGYSARLILIHPYGWKSAEWLKRISS
ncbi:MAG: hypothetical protein DRO13_01315 [Thermoprotei archaeon]|nr:MAG: hypothetical protein DRO13_01315 [Thermoprotei archaeon]